MKNVIKTGSWVRAVCILGLLFCIMLPEMKGIAAEDAQQGKEQVFDIDAQLLSSGERTYDIQLTIGNRGADWEGAVRVSMEEYDSGGNVYDTVLTLPQGSTKQFVVRIPKESIEYIGGAVTVSLISQKSVAAQKDFKRLLLEDSDMLSMGILSDSYPSLTYLDMGGEEVYYGGYELPVRLLELDQDNLDNVLDSLIFLVIDDYNTGVLTDKTKDHILQWVNDGGMLIVGTGEHAENTLSGLDALGVECSQVNKPGQGVYSGDYAAGLEQFSLAELTDVTGRYYTDTDSLVMVSSWGYGAVEFVPYALSDMGRPDRRIQDKETYIRELLQNINNYARIQHAYGNQAYYDNNYTLRRIFRTYGNGSSRLNFGVLKVIVVVYVVFVGPVLYLILRCMKKRDWYWIAVPVTTLAGILLVYFAGRGFEVVNTRVYSVTVENLSDRNSDAVTYMHCYDAGHKEWGLRLAEEYEYAGPFLQRYYVGDEDKYRSRICREGERISLGLNPDAGFEDCYFIAGTSRKTGTGSILSDIKPSAQWGITGTVTNETGRDFKRFAVLVENVLFVYGELPAGGTCSLEKADYTSRQEGYDTAAEAYLHGYMSDYYRGKGVKDIDITAALGTGVFTADLMKDSKATVIIGITENWDRAVDDDCTETSYGCLYAVQ